MSKSTAKHNWETLKQHYQHYKDLDFYYWERLARRVVHQITKLKREKSKYPYYLELYTDYIQMFESTIINMMAIMSGRLFEYLFIDSSDLRDNIPHLFPRMGPKNSTVNRWVREFVFQHAVFQQYTMSNPEQRIKEYKMMLEEASQDYLQDFQLLNAFKHGFRVRASGANTIAISLDNAKSQPDPHVVGKYNASILYYSKERQKDKKGERCDVVYENKISFNHQRVYQKILYLSNALENTRRTILHIAKPEKVGQKIQCQTLKVTDSQKFHRHFGSFRWRAPIATGAYK